MLIGFSTGATYKTYPSTSKEIIDVCLNLGCNAIEISVATTEEVKMLEENMDKIKNSLSKFQYVSLHCISMKFIFRDDEVTKKILEVFQQAYDKFNGQCLVVHPHLVEDWNVFNKFNFNLAVENMSDDVSFATPENLKPLFENNPDYQMVLDVNHSYKTYKSPKLTNELSSAFQDKISEIHLSGYETFHDPLYKTRQLDIIQSVPDKNLPIIIESGCNNVEEMEKELEYIKKHLY